MNTTYQQEIDTLNIGLEIAGFDERRRRGGMFQKVNIRRFKSSYGSRPEVLVAIWNDLRVHGLLVPSLINADVFKRFLGTMIFLKNYTPFDQLAGRLGLHENTVRNWTWFMIGRINSLKDLKIKFTTELTGTSPVPLTVDGVHCAINEPGHTTLNKNPIYYSHKFHQAGLAYEVALSTYRNAVVWINGPFPASKHDKTIFEEGLGLLLVGGRKAIADHGYRGSKKIIYSNSADSEEVKHMKARARARQESFNARIKNFKCLSTKFRHGLAKHQSVFTAVCIICQYQMENGSPLFDI